MDAGRDSLSTATTFVGTVMTSGGFTLYRNTKDKADAAHQHLPRDRAPAPGRRSAAPRSRPSTASTPRSSAPLVRPDGSKQLTVDGWPVYRYIKDMLPGTVNGQGVDGVWQAVGADGKPLTRRPRPPTAPAPPKQAPAKAAPAKAPAAAAEGRRADQGPGRRPEGDAQADRGPPTVVRDAPGTSSTD